MTITLPGRSHTLWAPLRDNWRLVYSEPGDGFTTIEFYADTEDEAVALARGYLSEAAVGLIDDDCYDVVEQRGELQSLDYDGEPEESARYLEAEYQAELPECEIGGECQWRSPYEVVGGCDSNPGVWSTGGTGISTLEVCGFCGRYKRSHHYGSQWNPGDPVERVELEERDEQSEQWLIERHTDGDGNVPEWLADLIGEKKLLLGVDPVRK